jgi:hypothetical protein
MSALQFFNQTVTDRITDPDAHTSYNINWNRSLPESIHYPLMFRLGQKMHGPVIGDVPRAVEAEISKLDLRRKVKPGDTVAVTCGHHRIANYAAILKAVVGHFKQLRANVVLVPAVGIHGGGTADGQCRLLQSLGITEESVGAAIRSSTETEIIGRLPEGVPVHCDRNALRADHTVVVNRVNLHPLFHGDVQSGLLEMIAFGLGKTEGAEHCYKALENSSFDEIAREVHKVMLKKANLLAGLMIVENGHQATARVRAALSEDFVAKEKALLQNARGLFPRLPFRFIDILLVDEIGTIFSCVGSDANVIGRKNNFHAAAEDEFPQIRTIVYRDLNARSHGDAIGVGYAEFVRSRLLGKADSRTTRLSALTVRMPTLAASPIDFETDREILDAALPLTSLNVPEKARIVWIRNTSSLAEFECSAPYLEEVQHWKDLSVLSSQRPFEFDSRGNLRDFVIE